MTYAKDKIGVANDVQLHLRAAVASIDAAFGEGYAAANPVLVGAFIEACSCERLAAALRGEVSDSLDSMGRAISGAIGVPD